jgi:catalase
MNDSTRGAAGELHQLTKGTKKHPNLTTNQGLPISDNQNSVTVGARGPALLEDFILREKITHFDHERIPERIVHARGAAAHGYFECTKPMAEVTKAAFLAEAGKRTDVFVRFSTVAGSKGSTDMARDVRGFATKFYTDEGNFDLVGNNIPVFFIQDAIKFPDLIHSVKPEPDRGFPQAASAHDTFWDFVSLTPESVHMLMWVMSDRAIPRSFRMMEGFGVHTFRLINGDGESRLVKFHWRPKLGSFSVLWDEAVKISGADSDFLRRDLWEAISKGDYPEFELALQTFTEQEAEGWDFDVLDATKLVPEELAPLEVVGRMVLDRNPDNFFAETEQVAFCPSHVVPGIGFSNDPLLQGRLFSYLDTQLKRLGSPNFHEIAINRPRCPMANFQRDGHMRQTVNTGRVAYEPNSLGKESPRENPKLGYETFPEPVEGEKLRRRAETFADHYSQARLFWRSQTKVEQDHIVAAFTFELGKVDTPEIRERMVSHLRQVDEDLAKGVADGLALPELPKPFETDHPAHDVPGSPALSIVGKAPKSVVGKKIGCLVTEGADGELLASLREAAEAEGATLEVIAPRRGGVRAAGGALVEADQALAGAPSVLFDCVAVIGSDQGIAALRDECAAVDFLQNAFCHLKVIGLDESGRALLEAAGLAGRGDAGVVALDRRDAGIAAFIDAAKEYRVWARMA